jgi:hypothetical protein
MKKVDLLREKLAEYEVEDFGYLGDVIVLFANSERWNSLSESARSEIEELLDQQLDVDSMGEAIFHSSCQVKDLNLDEPEEYGLELTDEDGNVRGARKRLGQ